MNILRAAVTCGIIASMTALDAAAVPAGQYAAAVNVPTTFVYPVMGPEISSGFGLRKHPVHKVSKHHHGIDLAAPAGAPIRAISSGHVIFADPFGGYGKFVVVKHSNGLTSHYGHMEKISVAPGQAIRSGDVIGTVGSTGISTGPHLHFEIRIEGKPQNPERYLPGLAADAQG